MAEESSGYAAGPRKKRAALFITIPVALVMAFIVAVLFASHPSGSDDSKTFLQDRAAPEVAGPTLDGSTFDLDAQRGRWVVVNFFATWCIPCKQEQPALDSFFNSHVSDPFPPMVVSVAFQDDPANIKRFFDTQGQAHSFPVVLASTSDQGDIALNYGITGVPESFLVDPTGVVRKRLVGGIRSGSDLDAQIQAIDTKLSASTTTVGSEAP